LTPKTLPAGSAAFAGPLQVAVPDSNAAKVTTAKVHADRVLLTADDLCRSTGWAEPDTPIPADEVRVIPEVLGLDNLPIT
jgi:hypothetical protein